MRSFIIAPALLTIGVAVGYIGRRQSGDTELLQSVHSLALAQSANETARYTRLLEGLRSGKTDLVTNRLETMLDYSVIEIAIEAKFTAPPHYVDEAVDRSLCLARNYRAVYPHRPSEDWAAKQYDAALALKTEDK
jgi:hypothetical protein